MSGSEMSTSHWITFFCNAGLPPNVAANYAIIFSDNRIQQSMLMDLSKEYLFDMGIKVMGDVIAILKYCKEFHNQLAQEKIIGNKLSPPAPVRKGSPASRILGHYTRPVTDNPSNHLSGNVQQKPLSSAVRKRIVLKPPEEHVVKKVRRVSPEEEGGYTIKMPAGTTERTRKILEHKQQQQQSPIVMTMKKSVFDRLGDNHVSSSTDVKRNLASGSVFKRLGPSGGEVSTSTSTQSHDPPLSYHGILKTPSVKKTVTSFKTVKNTAPTGIIRTTAIVKRLGVKSAVQSRRTVINNTKNLGVSQINSILLQNAKMGRTNNQAFGTKKISSRIVVNNLAADSVSTSTFGNQAPNRPRILKKNIGSRIIQGKTSVFQRLGK